MKNHSLILLRCLLKTLFLPPETILHSHESSLQWHALCRQRYSLCPENNTICYLQKSGDLGACVLTSVLTRAWFIDPINFYRDWFNREPSWLLQLGQAAWCSTLPSLLGGRPLWGLGRFFPRWRSVQEITTGLLLHSSLILLGRGEACYAGEIVTTTPKMHVGSPVLF